MVKKWLGHFYSNGRHNIGQYYISIQTDNKDLFRLWRSIISVLGTAKWLFLARREQSRGAKPKIRNFEGRSCRKFPIVFHCVVLGLCNGGTAMVVGQWNKRPKPTHSPLSNLSPNGTDPLGGKAKREQAAASGHKVGDRFSAVCCWLATTKEERSLFWGKEKKESHVCWARAISREFHSPP